MNLKNANVYEDCREVANLEKFCEFLARERFHTAMASNRHRLFGSQLAFEHIALVTLRPRSDGMFGEVQAARSPGDNPGFEER